jgi:hypothetical protein
MTTINYQGNKLPAIILQKKDSFTYLYSRQKIDAKKMPDFWVAGFRLKKVSK